MAVWYLNYGNGTNTGYYAVAQWAALHVYAAGDIVRQLATPAVGSERCFRTAAGGTSGAAEPSWTLTKGGTTAGDGSVTWTEVTGNSTYNWSAPFARLATAISSSWIAAGDTVYVATQHAETQSTAITAAAPSSATPTSIICVNQAGSVPPVSADLATGATVTTTGNSNITINGTLRVYGLNFYCGTGANNTILTLNNGSSARNHNLINCSLNVVATGSTGAISIGNGSAAVANASSYHQWTNCTASFGATGQTIFLSSAWLTWRNTASAITGATIPTSLFTNQTTASVLTLDGVDLSAVGSGNTLVAASVCPTQVYINNCKLGASVTVAATPTGVLGTVTDLLISDSGATQYRQERYRYQGTLTTETTFVRSGGASDGTTPISWKVVSTSNANVSFPFECFQVARFFPNATDSKTIGQSITATIEIENGGTTLTNADVWVDVEYLGSASFPVSSLVSSAPADILATAANLPTSSVTWNGGLGSAVKQYLQVTFTPNMVGYVRATVKVSKASQTLYIDPVITIA